METSPLTAVDLV